MRVYTYEQCAETFRGGPGAYGGRHEHAMSMMAEQHAAITLGLEWDLLTKPTPDPGWDLSIGDIHIDVKWTDKDSKGVSHLPVKLENREGIDLYVLVTGRDPNNLSLQGFATQSRVEACIGKVGFQMVDKHGMRKGQPTWMVPETALMSISLLYPTVMVKWPERFAAYVEGEYPQSAWDID